jgi:superfamily I DNA/RNA helicase
MPVRIPIWGFVFFANSHGGTALKEKFSPIMLMMDQLNKEQQRASEAREGVSLVLAGAGTGKTSTLVSKVKNVLRELEIGPHEILILTFSRRAATELRERIMSGAGGQGRTVYSGTFHSFCLDLLQNNRRAFLTQYGFSDFPSVIDDDRRKELIDELIYPRLHRFLGIPAYVVHDLVMNIHALDKLTERKLNEAGLVNELHLLLDRFIELKAEKNLIDYDDMINFTIKLLERNGELRNSVLERYRYLFVDEYQDVADDNFRLIKLLLPGKGGNLFAVGDDWQSIYGFRKARIGYIVKMKEHFPGAAIHRLSVNYRSRKEILATAVRFIRRNRFRTRKKLVSYKGRGGLVRFYLVESIEEEVTVIGDIITQKDPLMTSAILYRNNWLGQYLKKGLSAMDGIAGISFMTMHASKGLEFDSVIIAGISDRIIPDRENDIEEERRLLFVACTRAREQLHVIAYRNDDGVISRFGRELGITSKNSHIYS